MVYCLPFGESLRTFTGFYETANSKPQTVNHFDLKYVSLLILPSPLSCDLEWFFQVGFQQEFFCFLICQSF